MSGRVEVRSSLWSSSWFRTARWVIWFSWFKEGSEKKDMLIMTTSSDSVLVHDSVLVASV